MKLNTTNLKYKTGAMKGLRRSEGGEEESDERLELLEMLISSSNDAILITEGMPIYFPGPKIVYVNEAFTKMTGYSPEEIIGQTPRILQGPSADRESLNQIRQTLEEWGEIWVELINKRKDGTEYLTEVHIFPCGDQNPDGSFSFWAGVQRDITRQRQVEQERDDLEKQLRESEKLRAIGTLAGGVAHDFNNILTIIIGNLALLEKRLSPDLRRFTEPISEAAERAQSLTKQLLAVGRKSYKKDSIFSLNGVLNTVESLLRQSLPPSIEVRLEPAGDLPTIRGDEGLIQSVVLNLCLNARDAMLQRMKEEDGCQPMLLLRSYSQMSVPTPEKPLSELVVGCEVRDNGTGISDAVRPYIFEPFYSTKQGNETSSGLGLSTAYGIISQHKGAIRIETAVGQGTSFFVEIPAHAGAMTTPIRRRTTRVMSTGKDQPVRVMVVDDEPSICKIIETVLTEEGFDVVKAGDGLAALQLLRTDPVPVDIMFLDVLMPRLSGDKLIGIVREEFPGISVILMSGYSEVDREEKFKAMGANALLQKPFDGTRVIELAHFLVAKRQALLQASATPQPAAE